MTGLHVLLSAASVLGLAPAHAPASHAHRPTVVCTTASSLEGLAFCRHALNSGEFRVRALCRNIESSRAHKLAEMGAEVVSADNHDIDSLKAAFEGAHGVYAITTWSGSGFTADGTLQRAADLDSSALEESEVAQGLNILRAAEQTLGPGGHFVLQSMHRGGRHHHSADDATRSTSVPAPLHHRAKWRQEEALQASTELACEWSVLRQPTYMENFANDPTASTGTQLRLLRPGVVSGLLDADEELTVISVNDLGALATAIMKQGPKEHAGKIIAAGAERISGRSLAAAATRAHGESTFEYRQVPWFVLDFFIPVEYPSQLKRWLSLGGNDEGASAEGARELIERSHELHPEMQSLEEFLIEKGVRDLPVPMWQRAQKQVARRDLVSFALAAVPAAVAARASSSLLARPAAGLPISSLLASSGDGGRFGRGPRR